MKNYSLWMLKPDALERWLRDQIYHDIESSGLKVIYKKSLHLSDQDVGVLYEESKEQEYYDNIVQYITRDLVEIFIVQGEDALNRLNDLVWSTDPQKSGEDTLRKKYGKNILENSIHSSNDNRVDIEIAHLLQHTAAFLYKELEIGDKWME